MEIRELLKSNLVVSFYYYYYSGPYFIAVIDFIMSLLCAKRYNKHPPSI